MCFGIVVVAHAPNISAAQEEGCEFFQYGFHGRLLH